MPRFIFAIIFLFEMHYVYSQSAFTLMKDTLGFKLKVDQMSRETNALASDFTQVKNLSILSEKIVSKGTFVFLKQKNLRWEYTEPYKYIIVINKDKILIKEGTGKVKKYDMNANKVFKEINDIMISCVNGEILRSSKFRVSYFENNKLYKLELTPLNSTMKQSLKKINMFFDKSVSSVVKLEMIETGDDTTTIDFINKKINAAVTPQTFILK